VFHSALAALVAIPGHADYYKMRIINARIAFERETGEASKGVLRSKIQDEQLKAFRILALLPTPETVRVLGDFLEDEQDLQLLHRRDEAWAEGAWFGSNAEYALGALAKLPLISKPVPPRSGAVVVFAEDIEAWRLWYGQVKLGKRTFQFEGDPRVYNLEGAVPEVAVSTRPRKAGLPDRDTEASGAEEDMRVPWVAVGAALGLLGLAGFACLRSRHGNGGAAG
jgi:hypothetical protein